MWKGVLIEESLTSSTIISEIKIVSTRVTTLEKEEDKGTFHFHNLEVSEENLEKVVAFISQNIKDSWYFHLIKDEAMIVIFHNKVFHARKDKQEEIEQIRMYAFSQGIIAEQLPLEKLFDNPYL